jgi:hypothetical protein
MITYFRHKKSEKLFWQRCGGPVISGTGLRSRKAVLLRFSEGCGIFFP